MTCKVLRQAWRMVTLTLGGALLGVLAHATPTVVGQPWGHELTQRAPDPAVRFGHLPNGLRYAIAHNETPQDGVAMRLHIAAGSLQERDGEQGLAHFLEHMAFRGSAKVPDGEVVHLLQRQGLSFGPDTNAYTDFGQTVYHFNFPKADAAALDTGFMLFREIGQYLRLDAQLVAVEKGVILSEERVRDVPRQRALMAELNNTWAGTRKARRWPIGQIATIQAATASQLQRYYRRNYRPDNTTLVVVGNIDVDAVEHQIRERFADWRSNGQTDPLDMGTPKPEQPAVEFVSDGVGETLSLTWLLPHDPSLPTLAVERERLVTQVALRVLNSRLTQRASQAASPYSSASAELDASRAKLTMYTTPAQWREALNAVLEELRRLMQQGVQTDDLQGRLPLMRAQLQSAAQPTATRQSAAMADALVSAADTQGVYTSPAQDWAMAEPVLASLKPEEVSAALRRSFVGTPLLFRSTASEPVGANALTQQLTQAMTRALPERAPLPDTDWLSYIDFGAPSEVVSKTTDAELGTTSVQFANGTRLLVKPMAQEKGRVSIQVLLGQGRSGVPKERCHALWALGWAPLGGTSNQTSAGVSLRVEPYAFVVQSDWNPAFPLAQLKGLANFVRDAAFRPELGDNLAAAGPAFVKQLETQASSVFQRELERVMSGNEPRLANLPTAADVASTRLDDLPAMLGEALAGAVDVVIVGDLSVDDAIAATQATFGAGPERPRPPHLPLQVLPPLTENAAHVVTHSGRADQAVLGQAWPMPDHWTDPALSFTGLVAAAVLQARLVDSVREEMGITYSPTATASADLYVQGQGAFVVQLETPPDKFDSFRRLLKTQLLTLSNQPVSADELQRAKQPLTENSSKGPQHNGYWSAWLPRIQTDVRMKDAMLGTTAGLQAVSAEQVQAYFRDHIAKRQPIEVQAKAAFTPSPQPSLIP